VTGNHAIENPPRNQPSADKIPPNEPISNRQYQELESLVSYRKQRTDHFLIAKFRHMLRSRPAPARACFPASSLEVAASRTNRPTPRLESLISYRKQRLGRSSNRPQNADLKFSLSCASNSKFLLPPSESSVRTAFAANRSALPLLECTFAFSSHMTPLFGKSNRSLLERLKDSVSKTRSEFSARVEQLFTGNRPVDPALLAHLEAALLSADIGVGTTKEVLASLRRQVTEQKLSGTEQLKQELKNQLVQVLTTSSSSAPVKNSVETDSPRVIFVVGVNGTGKTTTIGKLAHRLKSEGKSVLLCAADTFRAAAIEQLEVWARRAGVEIIKQKAGSDPASVVFDGISAASAKRVDVIVVDTAGRLHTKSNLMAELEKMKRTAAKLVPGAPHEILLVMDATTGQNGLAQAREFTGHVGVTGIVLTKLDGTAKGGIVVALTRELNLPVQYVGTGEQIDDLVPFDAQTYVNSLID
jgi:fused signal recognition particle receptor